MLDKLLRSVARCLPTALLVPVVVCLGFKASAVPLDADATISFSGGELSVSLHGDFAGDVLTLNKFSPLSKLQLKTAALWDNLPVPPSVASQVNCPGVTSAFCATVTTNPNTTETITVPPWNFDIDGTIDFNTAINDTTFAVKADKLIAEYNAVGKPIFNVVANQNLGILEKGTAGAFAIALKAALNKSGTSGNYKVKGEWSDIQKKTPGAPPTSSKTGQKVTIDLDLGQIDLLGSLIPDVNFIFDSDVASLVGSAFKSQLEAAYETRLKNLFRPYIDGIDVNDNGFVQDCSGSATSSIDVTCTISAQLSFDATLAESVTEPGTLAIVAVGLAGFMGARRRRRPAG